MRTVFWRGLVGVFVFLTVGCQTAVSAPDLTPISPSPFPSPQPSPTLSLGNLPPTQNITPTPPSDTGWQLLQNGLERRIIRLFNDDGQQIEELYLLRLDPTRYTFKIAYSPGQPKSLSTWQAETEALIVVNGGYFTDAYEATGLTIIDGVQSGISYQGYGGMFAVTKDEAAVHSLVEQPYAADKSFTYALQSFPLLVKPGGQLGFPDEDGVKARRTVVAQNRAKQLLFILAPYGSFTLHEMSRFLVQSDLEIDTALNLDGGPSSGLILAEPVESVPAFAVVPSVIVVFPND